MLGADRPCYKSRRLTVSRLNAQSLIHSLLSTFFEACLVLARAGRVPRLPNSFNNCFW